MVAQARGRKADARRRASRGGHALARKPRAHSLTCAQAPSRCDALHVRRVRDCGRASAALVARTMTLLLMILLCLLVFAAWAASVAARRESERSGLPKGSVIYSDT